MQRYVKLKILVTIENQTKAASPPEDANGLDWLGELVDAATLTPKGGELAHFLAVNPRLAMFGSASEVAEKCEMNVATVVRFAQALGFSGWRDFQVNFRGRHLSSLMPSDVMAAQGTGYARSSIDEALHRDIHNLHGALHSLDREAAESAARAIAAAPYTLCISAGSYSAVGLVLTHLASFMGYPIVFESRSGPHIVAAMARLKPGDCLVAISFWQLVKHVVLAAEHCRGQGITTIAITDSTFSPLARSVDHTLVVPTESVSFFQSMTAATSLVYGLLARLQELGGEDVTRTIGLAQAMYAELDVLV
jgi:DNA-binding MurR/RpiR family transcriptional regulator